MPTVALIRPSLLSHPTAAKFFNPNIPSALTATGPSSWTAKATAWPCTRTNGALRVEGIKSPPDSILLSGSHVPAPKCPGLVWLFHRPAERPDRPSLDRHP